MNTMKKNIENEKKTHTQRITFAEIRPSSSSPSSSSSSSPVDRILFVENHTLSVLYYRLPYKTLADVRIDSSCAYTRIVHIYHHCVVYLRIHFYNTHISYGTHIMSENVSKPEISAHGPPHRILWFYLNVQTEIPIPNGRTSGGASETAGIRTERWLKRETHHTHSAQTQLCAVYSYM